MKSRLADPLLRREVEAAVRRRVRGDDAEDVVQATLADVLSAAAVPDEPDEFRRYVFGVARNKVFDHFRRQKRQGEELDEHNAAAPEPPLSARDILRWAEGELPDSESHSTLEWMLREGDGEKLEHIARDARLPATRVRKRVSRLRKLLRERWAAELMLIGALLLLGGLGVWYWLGRGKNPDDFVKREPLRPVPSALPQLQPQLPEPSRPAGSTSPVPNRVAPPRAVPSPSSAPTPDPSSLLSNGRSSPQNIKDAGTEKTARPRAVSTEIAPSKLAPPKASPKPSISKKTSSDFTSNDFPDAK